MKVRVVTASMHFDKKVFSVLFFSLFITVTGVGIVVPLLPVYASQLGASGFLIGFLFSAFSLSRTISLFYCGRLSDKKGRKPFLLMGLFSYTIISFLFVFADSMTTLIIVRFIQGFASGMIMPVCQAYVGDITPKGKEGVVMGIFNVSMFLGLSLGPVSGGFLADTYGLDMTFIIMGAMSFAAFLISFLFLPAVKDEVSMQKEQSQAAYLFLLKDRSIFALSAFRFVYTACLGIIWSFFPIFADTEFSLSSSATGFLLMLSVFVSGLLQSPLGYLADRVNKNGMILLGGVVICYAINSYGQAVGFNALMVSNLLFGIGGGILMPAMMAIAVIKGNEYNAMGSVMALLTMAHSSGMFVGGTLAGIIVDMTSIRDAFFWGAVLMGVGVLIYGRSLFGKKRALEKPVENEQPFRG